MRTLRVSLTGTVILTLLGGLGGAVLAQDEAATPDEPVPVTGTVTSERMKSFGTTVEGGGFRRTERPWWASDWTASDPRLSGQAVVVSNRTEEIATGLVVGATTYVLLNDDGRWEGSGHSFGPLPKSGEGVETAVLRGKGGYDGLTAALRFLPAGDSGSTEFEGLIFPGKPPVVPEPVAAVGGTAPAEDEPESIDLSEVVAVAGTWSSDDCEWVKSGEDLDIVGAHRWRDLRLECPMTSSDPRMTGTALVVHNGDIYEEAGVGVMWGTFELDGPDGGWDCSLTETADPIAEASEVLALVVCSGTYGYAGLAHVGLWALHEEGAFGEGTNIDGFIYPGDPPPPWGRDPLDQ